MKQVIVPSNEIDKLELARLHLWDLFEKDMNKTPEILTKVLNISNALYNITHTKWEIKE